MEAKDLRTWAGVVGILAGAVAIATGVYAHFAAPALGHPWRPFINVLENTAVFSAVGILIGTGIIMVVGGVIAFRSAVWGGLVVIVPAVVGLVYCYTHEWHRLDLIYYWAAPVVLAVELPAVLAGQVSIPERQVRSAVELLEGGATVPFIARYRKGL